MSGSPGTTLAFDQPAEVWRDLRELWAWCLELAHAPETGGHPSEVEIWGAAAEAARQAGRNYDPGGRGWHAAAGQVAGEAAAGAGVARRRAAGLHWPESRTTAATSPPPLVDSARESARASGPEAAGLLASAALGAGFGGDRAHAAALLAEARQQQATTPNGSNHAFITYVEGELVRRRHQATAIASYVAAVEEARSVGANFVAGVAGVALAAARARTGDPATTALPTATC